ncbi:MAG: Spi family protease inhibitor, partial [Porphyromonadaceae bacterium]|nr:Spi family protease inhibitor [Porphyromonadaceae bacterium]
MIAGDDELPLTLGYSPIGAFSDKNMPDNLQSFIEAYQESIRCILADGSNHYEARTQSLSEEVSPLLKDIRWNQDYPWNAKTPIADKNHTPVGCV